MARAIRFLVPGELDDERLDKAVQAAVPELSRAQARDLLRLGAVFVDGKRTKRESKAVRRGQRLDVHVEALTMRAALSAEAPELPLLYEDEDVVVLDKPSGLLSAPTPESDRDNALFWLGRTRPTLHLVHRLDRNTSGVLLFAKTKAAAAHLGRLFQEHDLERSYLALVEGSWLAPTVVEHAVEGRSARTDFTPQRSAAGVTLVEARLHTGRTHQVRIHASVSGHPILGDARYGRRGSPGELPRPPRLALHAHRLALSLPDGSFRAWEAEWPGDLRDYFERLA